MDGRVERIKDIFKKKYVWMREMGEITDRKKKGDIK